jgi:hypothetical protein
MITLFITINLGMVVPATVWAAQKDLLARDAIFSAAGSEADGEDVQKAEGSVCCCGLQGD